MKSLVPETWFARVVLFFVLLALLTYGVGYAISAAGGSYSQLPPSELKKG